MTTIDTDENLGLGLRQALKCGIQSLPFFYI